MPYTPITMKIVPKKKEKKKRDGWKKRDKKRSETRCETESGKVYRVGGKDGNDKQEKGRRNFFSKRKRYCTSINLKKKKKEKNFKFLPRCK